MKNLGTPKSLKEAIEREMQFGPASTFVSRCENAVKDYMSQKFTAAQMTATTEQNEALTNLWMKIFPSSSNEK